MFDPSLSIEDLKWIREVWKGPLCVKGILTGEDTRRAVDDGADGLIVSNHGGRQLDRCPASIQALTEVLRCEKKPVQTLKLFWTQACCRVPISWPLWA